MRTRILAPALVVVFLTMSCKSLDVQDFNASALSDLQNKPTAASVATAATGLLVGNRLTEEIPQVAFTAITGELGREGYSLDPSNPNITVTRLQAMDDAFSAGGASVWSAVYRSIKQAGFELPEWFRRPNGNCITMGELPDARRPTWSKLARVFSRS